MPIRDPQQIIDRARSGRISRVIYTALRNGSSVQDALDSGRRYSNAPQNWTYRYVRTLATSMRQLGLINNINQSPIHHQNPIIPETNLNFDLSEEINAEATYGIEIELLIPNDISNEELCLKIRGIKTSNWCCTANAIF